MHATVFGVRISPFVEKVARGLQLKRIPFTLVPPASPFDFKRWSPQTGKMPVLDLDGEKTFDSTLILRRLDALVPSPPLFADDPHAAAPRQRFVEDWSDESLYWYGMALRWKRCQLRDDRGANPRYAPGADPTDRRPHPAASGARGSLGTRHVADAARDHSG